MGSPEIGRGKGGWTPGAGDGGVEEVRGTVHGDRGGAKSPGRPRGPPTARRMDPRRVDEPRPGAGAAKVEDRVLVPGSRGGDEGAGVWGS